MQSIFTFCIIACGFAPALADNNNLPVTFSPAFRKAMWDVMRISDYLKSSFNIARYQAAASATTSSGLFCDANCKNLCNDINGMNDLIDANPPEITEKTFGGHFNFDVTPKDHVAICKEENCQDASACCYKACEHAYEGAQAYNAAIEDINRQYGPRTNENSKRIALDNAIKTQTANQEAICNANFNDCESRRRFLRQA